MKLLWVKSDFLHPTNRGGQIRSLEILKRLHRRHEVHYIAYENPAQPEGLLRAGEYCSFAYPVQVDIPPRASISFAVGLARNLFSSIPLALSRYQSEKMRTRISAVLRDVRCDRIVCDFIFPAPNFEKLADVVLFQHNVETMIWRRHSEYAPDPVRKLYFKVQANRMFAWEKRLCVAAAHVLAVSPQDAAMMRKMFGISKVSCIPTGVDCDYFRHPRQSEPKSDLIFVGSMDWLPNVDGIEYFVHQILPLIRRRMPGCTLAIVGRSPSPTIQALAARDPGIIVTGTVPDVRPWLWGAKLSIVPLRIGGGTRLKIYEAMAAGTATVSTSIGAEGLEVSHPANIRLADLPTEFAEQCVELLQNQPNRERLAAEALAMVASHFSQDVVAAEFERLLMAAPPPAGARSVTVSPGS